MLYKWQYIRGRATKTITNNNIKKWKSYIYIENWISLITANDSRTPFIYIELLNRIECMSIFYVFFSKVFFYFIYQLLFPFLFSFLCNAENYDSAFEFSYRGPITMKGKAEPMKVWFLNRAECDRANIPQYEDL